MTKLEKAINLADEIHNVLEQVEEWEVKPYGGFIDFPYKAGEPEAYTEIVERMIYAGILKVVKQEGPMSTRFNWAIKAVKWE